MNMLIERSSSAEKPPEQRLSSISKRLQERVQAHDFEIEGLAYEQALDSLGYALKKGEGWAKDRLVAFERAVQNYLSANNVRRLEVIDEIKEQIAETLADFKNNRSK